MKIIQAISKLHKEDIILIKCTKSLFFRTCVNRELRESSKIKNDNSITSTMLNIYLLGRFAQEVYFRIKVIFTIVVPFLSFSESGLNARFLIFLDS